MNELQIFSNPEFGQVRTVEIEGEPWLVGKDVAQALGYTNPQKAIRDHVDDDDRGVNEMVTPGGKQMVPIINESGLYSLVLSSKLPGAKRFRRWVTSEVLPARLVRERKPEFFRAIYHDLKNRFGVPSYRDIRPVDYASAVAYVENWIEPAELRWTE